MSGGLSGSVPTYVGERDRLIPVTLRLRPDERSKVQDLMTLDTFVAGKGEHVPLDQIGTFRTELFAPRICRRDNERCMTVKCDTIAGVLHSRAVSLLDRKLAEA